MAPQGEGFFLGILREEPAKRVRPARTGTVRAGRFNRRGGGRGGGRADRVPETLCAVPSGTSTRPCGPSCLVVARSRLSVHDFDKINYVVKSMVFWKSHTRARWRASMGGETGAK